jgi:hypothetical protein
LVIAEKVVKIWQHPYPVSFSDVKIYSDPIPPPLLSRAEIRCHRCWRML